MAPAYRISSLALIASLATATHAQQSTPQSSEQSAEIVVTAQAENATEVVNGGSAGVLGDKPAEDLPFTIRSYDESLIRHMP